MNDYAPTQGRFFLYDAGMEAGVAALAFGLGLVLLIRAMPHSILKAAGGLLIVVSVIAMLYDALRLV